MSLLLSTASGNGNGLLTVWDIRRLERQSMMVDEWDSTGVAAIAFVLFSLYITR